MSAVIEIKADDDEHVYLTPELVKMDRQTRYELLLNIAGALLLISIVVLLFFLVGVRSTKIKPTEAPEPNIFQNINISNFVLNIVPRENWKAQASRHAHKKLTLPVHRILVGHTGFNECQEFNVCTKEILKLQTFYMDSKHFDDIGWNFMIGGDGTVYEGCGWTYEGFHTSGYDAGSSGIAFIGNFSRNVPTHNQFIALYLLIQEGVRLKNIARDYRLYPQRVFLPLSDSPGTKVIDGIKNWPHFNNH